MKLALTFFLSIFAGVALAQNSPRKILLIPVDDRPAVTHFAQMIGNIADIQVVTPPEAFLGKFKQPGSPDSILLWLKGQDLSQYDAVVLSADMIAYGGLIASRTDRSSQNLAMNRLRELWRIRKTSYGTPFYVFSTLTRIAPTAVAENRAWRNDLANWAINQEKYDLYKDPEAKRKAAALAARVPAEELARYKSVRSRNVAIQTELLKMTYHGAFNHLTFGQDDAAAVGPHIREIASLNREVDRLKLGNQSQFCMGIDQISNCLISRVLCDQAKWNPTVAIRYADANGPNKVAAYETEPIRESLRDQIETSGAFVTTDQDKADYILFLNTPEPNQYSFDEFVREMSADITAGKHIAVADTNLGWSGTADPALFEALTKSRQGPQLVSYAGWNTAGNTMGTTIPAANAYLLALHTGVDGLNRETAARKFVLHRLVTDYFYNRYVRPEAYRMIEKMQDGNREEISKTEDYDIVAEYVKKDMEARLRQTFLDQMVANPFKVKDRIYHVVQVKDIVVELPWPRAYEVHLDFNLEVREEKQ
ncbi:MAG: DUF4127 family protein [Fimbriimonadaceae bacterium]|nr:MAG: DUF4127 family protein [Fimbriimonadaceae bacterium]